MQVAFVPGEAFGADRCVRLSYATSETVITQSIQAFASFLGSLQRRKAP